jgi:hypothetical protein
MATAINPDVQSCKYCHGPHTLRDCTVVPCRTCGEVGHVFFRCLKHWCERCRAYAEHTTTKCPLPQCVYCFEYHNNTLCPNVQCIQCEGIGHLVEHCAIPAELWYCRWCKAAGPTICHILPTCPVLAAKNAAAAAPREERQNETAPRKQRNNRAEDKSRPPRDGKRNDDPARPARDGKRAPVRRGPGAAPNTGVACRDPGHNADCKNRACIRAAAEVLAAKNKGTSKAAPKPADKK